MKSSRPVVIVCLAALLVSCMTVSTVRYSSNPIGKPVVLGIQISESVDSANRMLQDPFGKNFLKYIDWPLVIDPSYKQLKEPAAVTLSFGDRQVGGVTYGSAILTDMGFAEDIPGFILVLDRHQRVRGFCRGFIADGERQDRMERELNRLVEDLLLNLDGGERITYAEEGISQQGIVSFGGTTAASADDTAIFDFQTDLKKALILDQRRKAGVSLMELPFFKYLGGQLPDYMLKRPDGTDVGLHELLGPQVTILVVFISPENPGMRNNYNGVGLSLQTARKVSDNFAKGMAGPGRQSVMEARPDAP
jgi:hypothetical protein